jgi:ABC-type Na+ transport system ATPase subunit NatA
MSNVMTEIAKWAADLPYWEQAVLDKVIVGESFIEEDYDQLLQYLLEDEHLADAVSKRPQPRFYRELTQEAGTPVKIQLNKITNLKNINALIPNQTLTFGPALTAIFGANGSGKSGYARVLGSAGFSRGDRDVLPDISKLQSDVDTLTADVVVSVEGTEKIINYQLGSPCPELASFYVFDSTSVHVHMSEQNAFSFSPAGLSSLKQLSDETDRVRERLLARVENCCKPCDITGLFQGSTEVSQIIANIGPETELDHLKSLAELSPEEKKRRSELNILIANVELDKIKIQIADLKLRKATLGDFKERLDKAYQHLGDDEIRRVNQAIEHFLHCQEVVKLAGAEQFSSKYFKATGSVAWHNFIDAAKSLAGEESLPDKPYPQEQDYCILCQQPLSVESRLLILKLWEYLKGDAQANLEAARQILDSEIREIKSITLFEVTSEFSTPYQYLKEQNPTLLSKVEKFVQALHDRYDNLVLAIEGCRSTEINPLPEDCREDLDVLLGMIGKQLEELERENQEEKVKKLEAEKLILEHRVLLEKLYPQVETYVKQRQWAQAASTVGGSTKHITAEHNKLFKELVTNEYIRLFEQTLTNLGRPLMVKVATPGRKGETLRQITLVADSTAKDIAKPDKVLSEGEKRAVALADFLTEVALDTTSGGIVLDDPVTSLDLEWREVIAEILAAEAQNRQVIVFTHDLPFLYFLKTKVEQKSLPVLTHWIKRGDQDDRPGYVFQNNSPALEREYRKSTRALSFYEQAKKADAELQESLLHAGFGALRTSYEAFIIFDMFEEVVMRWSERISFGRLKDICWDNVIAKEVIDACERLSRYIEGHLHSDTLQAVKPKPETLLQEIEIFDALQKSLKSIKSKK